MITFRTRPTWLLALAMSTAGVSCNGGSLLPGDIRFPSSLSFPQADGPASPGPADEAGASKASARPATSRAAAPSRADSAAPRPSPAPASTAYTPTAYTSTAYTWAELSSRGRDALSAGEFAAAESAYLSALAQTDAMEAHDVRVDTSLLNLIQLAQALDEAGLYPRSEALIDVLILQQRADRRADFDLAGPLMLAMAQRDLAAGDSVGAAAMARAALGLAGAADPMNAQLRGEIEAIAWPRDEAPRDLAEDPQDKVAPPSP
jgi:hypothetical protein